MVQIAPFRGLVYNSHEILDHGALLTSPPYDVLSPKQRDEYHLSHPHNFTHLDLGAPKSDDVDSLDWHDRSAEIMKKWLSEGVLVRRDRPGYYVMETECLNPVTGENMVRQGFVALMKLEEVTKEARVRLHEKTFSSHKVERLDLMKKTKAHLSPVFGFFPDPQGKVLKSLSEIVKPEPDFNFTDRQGLTHRLSIIEDSEVAARLTKGLEDQTVYVADGHHRYETALMYRRELLAEFAQKGQTIPFNSVLNYVMVYLCPMSAPGLCILPTHRLLTQDVRANREILAALEPYVEEKPFSFVDGGESGARQGLLSKLADDNKKGLSVIGLFLAGDDRYHFLKIKEKVKQELNEVAPELAAVNSLDVSILTNVLLMKALGLTEKDLDNPECINYVSLVDEALTAVSNGEARAAFLLNPTSVGEILKVTESGHIMPRKATYFYPKVTNGLVFNVIDPQETVSLPIFG